MKEKTMDEQRVCVCVCVCVLNDGNSVGAILFSTRKFGPQRPHMNYKS